MLPGFKGDIDSRACSLALVIRKGGIVLFTNYLTLFRLFRDYLI